MNKDVNVDYLTAQELHDKMQTTHDCILITLDITNCIPQIIIFTQEVFNHPLFKEDIQKELKKLEMDFFQLLELKNKILYEFQAVKNLIFIYKSKIPALSYYLEEYTTAEGKCAARSFELIFDIELIFNRICSFLNRIINEKVFYEAEKAKIAKTLLEKLALLDRNGKITEYTYSPSLAQFHAEHMNFKRLKKMKLWYFLHKLHHLYILYDIRKYSGQLSFFNNHNQLAAAFFLKDDFFKLEQALEDNNEDNNEENFIELNEYKSYIKHVWTFFKPKLLNHQELTYSYSNDANDLREGLLKKGIAEHKFIGESAEVLFVVLKHINITKNELEEKTKLSKTQVNDAIGVIQKAARKKLNLPKYISSSTSFSKFCIVNF